VADEVFALFDEYAVRRARGERPDVRDYLARAGEGADELRELIDRLAVAAPPLEPSEDEAAAVQAWLAGEPPLLELRTRRGIKRAQIVDALVERLRLEPGKREKVAGYVHRAETGLLDPGGVDPRVWEVWGEVVRARVADVLGLRPRRVEAAQAMYRVTDRAAFALKPAESEAEIERDDIDDLFLGG
jgi:hypothetical protein